LKSLFSCVEERKGWRKEQTKEHERRATNANNGKLPQWEKTQY
jgi:hypothetical protein